MTKIQEVRAELEKLPREKFWQIGAKTGNLLKNTVIEVDAKTVLEIGTSSGYSALWIIEGLKQTSGHLHTIESNDGRFDIARSSFEKAEVESYVTQIKGHAPECIPDINVDLVFIDATKKETVNFIKSIYPRLNKGGRIIIDNVNSHIEKFAETFEYLEKENMDYKKLDIEDGLIIIYSAS